MTQVERVLDYLKDGKKLTCLNAFEELGITEGKIGIDHVSMIVLNKLKEALPKAEFVDGDQCVLAAQVVNRVKTFDFGAKEDIVAVTIIYPIDFLPAA